MYLFFMFSTRGGRVRVCFCLRCVLDYLGSSQRGYTKQRGNKMNENQIVTLVVEVTNYATGAKITPIFECYGDTKFEEFFAWYEKELPIYHNALLKGYASNNPNPVRTMVVVK